MSNSSRPFIFTANTGIHVNQRRTYFKNTNHFSLLKVSGGWGPATRYRGSRGLIRINRAVDVFQVRHLVNSVRVSYKNTGRALSDSERIIAGFEVAARNSGGEDLIDWYYSIKPTPFYSGNVITNYSLPVLLGNFTINEYRAWCFLSVSLKECKRPFKRGVLPPVLAVVTTEDGRTYGDYLSQKTSDVLKIIGKTREDLFGQHIHTVDVVRGTLDDMTNYTLSSKTEVVGPEVTLHSIINKYSQTLGTTKCIVVNSSGVLFSEKRITRNAISVNRD